MKFSFGKKMNVPIIFFLQSFWLAICYLVSLWPARPFSFGVIFKCHNEGFQIFILLQHLFWDFRPSQSHIISSHNHFISRSCRHCALEARVLFSVCIGGYFFLGRQSFNVILFHIFLCLPIGFLLQT